MASIGLKPRNCIRCLERSAPIGDTQHRVDTLRDCENPGVQRDCLTHQPARVPCSVPTFVVMKNCCCYKVGKSRLRGKLGADLHMPGHLAALIRAQRPGRPPEGTWKPDFPHVVQQRSALQRLQVAGRQLDDLGKAAGHALHSAPVTAMPVFLLLLLADGLEELQFGQGAQPVHRGSSGLIFQLELASLCFRGSLYRFEVFPCRLFKGSLEKLVRALALRRQPRVQDNASAWPLRLQQRDFTRTAVGSSHVKRNLAPGGVELNPSDRCQLIPSRDTRGNCACLTRGTDVVKWSAPQFDQPSCCCLGKKVKDQGQRRGNGDVLRGDVNLAKHAPSFRTLTVLHTR